jgi:hypothetical protein
MAELGNSIVNKVYEANIDPEFARATPKCHGYVQCFLSDKTERCQYAEEMLGAI